MYVYATLLIVCLLQDLHTTQINNVTPEWQYLLDIAGVTEPMLRDPATLNFILDAVVKSGGAPRMLGDVEEEAIREGVFLCCY